MIRFAIDEDLDHHILRGVVRRLPDLDVARARDKSGSGAPDEAVLAWAAEAGRVVLTHDASTMTAAAYHRLAEGLPMSGVIIVPQWLAIGDAIEDLCLIAQCSQPEDWDGEVRYLPLA